MDDVDRAERPRPFLFGLMAVPAIGFYDGVFGPGASSSYVEPSLTLAGYGVLKATATQNCCNFGSNVGGFAVFALAGRDRLEDRADDGRHADFRRALAPGWR